MSLLLTPARLGSEKYSYHNALFFLPDRSARHEMVQANRSRMALMASDHLPLVADFRLSRSVEAA